MSHLFEQFNTIMTSTDVTTTSAILKLVVSALLGGIIGYERKQKGQIAGSRTFALISMGATLAMLVSYAIPQFFTHLANGGDPARIAAQVISGIGFLGAGAIIQTKSSVRGLTTAAGIWVSAGLGLAVGIGLYIVAFIAMILILITLVVINNIENHLCTEWITNNINIRIAGNLSSINPYKAVLARYKIKLHEWYITVDYKNETTTLNFVVQMGEHTDVLKLFEELQQIQPTENISLRNEI